MITIRHEVNDMKIYVDFDDCLCETARAFTEIANSLVQITKDVRIGKKLREQYSAFKKGGCQGVCAPWHLL